MILRNISAALLALLLSASAHAQVAEAAGTDQPTALRPMALGAGQLRAEIHALGNTLRILQITAHPGDEDGALLLYEARGQGTEVVLLTLTRGEHGDNRHAIMEPTEQALLRTMEQLASDAQYGVEQRFTRVVDFGFARTSGEVFDRWGGHDAALSDMVRVIRESHPAIIVTPFDPDAADGDGQHAATAILVREAFAAAADAKRFPEQLSEGLEAWRAKRLFALTRSGGYSVAFNADETGAGQSQSWRQQAANALAQQRSQENNWHAPREAVRRYRLIASAPGFALAEGAKDMAEGLDSGLESLADAVPLGWDQKLQMQSHLKAMREAAEVAGDCSDLADCVLQLAGYLHNLREVEEQMPAAHPGAQSAEKIPAWVRAEVAAKRKQAERALLLAADVHLQARLAGDENGDVAYVLVPGAQFAVEVQVQGVGKGTGVHVATLELKPEGGRWTPHREWNPGDTHAVFRGRVPADAPFTRPSFFLESEADGAYWILDAHNPTRALPPPPLQAVAEIEIAGEVVRASAPVQASYPSATQSAAQSAARTLMVAPPVSVIVEPRTHWNRRTNLAYGEIEVRVRSNLPKLENALLSVHPPSGWRAEPEHEVLEIEGRGEEHGYRFFLVQERGGPGNFPVRALVRWGGMVFDQGYTIVRGPGEQVAFDYRSSTGSLISAAVEVPEGLEVGYVGVAGDPIPDTLRDIGVKVTELDRDELVHGRLAKYWAIVLGNHAVDARPEPAEARTQLLGYAEQGGVLLMLAQADAACFSANAPLPYPLELGAARISNPASAVERIEEHDAVFWDSNELGGAEFEGWAEERGQCLALRWDGHYEPLLRTGDPGQPMQDGLLLRARYGRGYVIYTGLSFYRQLPEGVPGALRLLVNLLSQAAELHR